MTLVPRRRSDPEWMDRAGNDPADLRGALLDIGAVNRLLGGRRALLGALEPFLGNGDGGAPTSILDVGTGGGDLAVAMARHARTLRRRVEIVAVDIDPTTAAVAAATCAPYDEIRVMRADAFGLPFRPASFDVVTASLFLHHFDDDAAVRLLAAFRGVARRAVVINDLRRHRVPWAFIAVAARVVSRHPMFVHDAPLSVLKGFTASELAEVGRRAGAHDAVVERRWPFRLILKLPGGGGAR